MCEATSLHVIVRVTSSPNKVFFFVLCIHNSLASPVHYSHWHFQRYKDVGYKGCYKDVVTKVPVVEVVEGRLLPSASWEGCELEWIGYGYGASCLYIYSSKPQGGVLLFCGGESGVNTSTLSFHFVSECFFSSSQ